MFEKGAFATRFNHPVVTFSRVGFGTFLFAKSFIERQVVADGVLPATFTVTVPFEAIVDPFVDLGQGEFAFGRLENGHANQSCIGIGGF